MNRETITYQKLSFLMFGKNSEGVLSGILGHIAFYCIANHLPQLNVIVVNKKTGRPGDLIPMNGEKSGFDSERERVYSEDWYGIVPPSGDDLACAYTKKSSLRPIRAK